MRDPELDVPSHLREATLRGAPRGAPVRPGPPWRPPVRVNLRYGSVRTDGVFLAPAPGRPEIVSLTPRVQLYRQIGHARIPAPVLHRVGYVVVPYRAAPRCSTGGGPYGRIVYVRPGRPLGYVGRQRISECPRCAETPR